MCAFLILFIYNIPTSKIKSYANYEVNGTVESYSFKASTFSIKLYDDKNIYYIDNVVYSAIDKELKNVDLKNKSVDLLIGYKDKTGKSHISQITYNGKVYLDKELSWKCENDNYIHKIIIGSSFLGVGVLLSIYLIINVINYKKKSKDYLKISD